MRILLINPPFHSLMGVEYIYFPLGLGYIAAVLEKAGFKAMIYNAENFYTPGISKNCDSINFLSRSLSYPQALEDDSHAMWIEIKKLLRKHVPDLVGLFVTSPNSGSAKKISSLVREYKSDCRIVWGGPHPAFLAEDILKDGCADFVIRGEGEEAIVELCRFISGRDTGYPGGLEDIRSLSFKKQNRVIHNAPRPFIQNLDNLPFPARHLSADPGRYGRDDWGNIIGSRGCPFECIFCCAHKIWTRAVRFRSPANILKEIKQTVDEYGTRRFMFQDDCFTLNRRWAEEICLEIISSGLKIWWECLTRIDILDYQLLKLMKRSGCYRVHIGIESGSPRMLNLIKKDISSEQMKAGLKLLRRVNMNFCLLFMIGFPQERDEDLSQTVELMKNLGFNQSISLSMFTPYPGTEGFDICRDLNLIPEKFDWYKFSHQSSENYFAKDISRQRLMHRLDEMAAICNKHNYGLPSMLKKARISVSYWRTHPGLIMRGCLAPLSVIQRQFHPSADKKPDIK